MLTLGHLKRSSASSKLHLTSISPLSNKQPDLILRGKVEQKQKQSNVRYGTFFQTSPLNLDIIDQVGIMSKMLSRRKTQGGQLPRQSFKEKASLESCKRSPQTEMRAISESHMLIGLTQHLLKADIRYNKNMTNTPTSDNWLQSRHNQWNTPPGLINEYVRKATGSAVGQASRLVLGVDNEVYDVITNGHHRLIVRISHKENHRFQAERWALDAARNAGVPTPHVLLVEQAEYDSTTVTFCIEEKLPGTPLDVLLKDSLNNDVNKAIDQIGEVLSKLHSVQVDGFGYLQPDGKGWPISFAEIMLMANERQAELYEAAKKWHVPAKNITAGLELLSEHSELYQFNTPVLVHGDLGQKHILVEGDHISGIIDMQDCSGNHPIIDFVMWDAYWSERIPTSRLIASYGNQRLFTGTYDTLFHLVLLRESFIMLMVHAARENPNGIQDFIAGMERALRYFAN